MGHICLYVNAYIAVQCLLSGNNAVVLEFKPMIYPIWFLFITCIPTRKKNGIIE